MQSVFPLDSGKLREFYKTSRSKKFPDAVKTCGYILTFRCVNCGRPEASASFACEAVMPNDQIEARIYEANCESCGWKAAVCGLSAIEIHPTPDLKLKPQRSGN
jgi:MinD superfamily P-loop ATPase